MAGLRYGIKDVDLPAHSRPDLTPYLIHLTKDWHDRSALKNLLNILRTGRIRGTQTYVKGNRKAACFMDIPFSSLKYICSRANAMRYQPYGIVVKKTTAFVRGARPVLYLSYDDCKRIKIPSRELWRVVALDYDEEDRVWVSNWLHEREWRCPAYFELPPTPTAALVKTSRDAKKLQEVINANKGAFASVPKRVIALSDLLQVLSRF